MEIDARAVRDLQATAVGAGREIDRCAVDEHPGRDAAPRHRQRTHAQWIGEDGAIRARGRRESADLVRHLAAGCADEGGGQRANVLGPEAVRLLRIGVDGAARRTENRLFLEIDRSALVRIEAQHADRRATRQLGRSADLYGAVMPAEDVKDVGADIRRKRGRRRAGLCVRGGIDRNRSDAPVRHWRERNC